MNNYPEYAKVGDKQYKINTDFRYALRCQEVATDESIGDRERALAIIYILFGEEALDNLQDCEKLLKIACKYLKCGKEEPQKDVEQDMDFNQDISLIEPSFIHDYGIDLENKEMHWWKFFDLLNGLSEECVLNRVRGLRTFDLSTITDDKEKRKIKELQDYWKLKEKPKELTDKQKENLDNFYKLTGIKRKGE